MTERGEPFDRLVAIWNGELDLAELDSLVAPGYVGHIGSRVRNLAQLKLDISDYRAQTPGVVFSVQHQFGEDDYLATRLEACAPGAQEQAITGINVSRWHDGLLVEEWAVWERFRDT